MITINWWALVPGAVMGLGICFLIALAIWLVFSRRHAAIRTIAFVASVLLMGSVAGEPWAREMPSEVFAGTIILVLLLVGFALLMRSRATNIMVATAVLLLLGYYPIARALESHGSPMYFSASLAILIPVASLVPLRLIGYRLLRLTGSVSDRDLEIGTGRELDRWLAVLCEAGADQMERPEIVSYLRRDGIPFTWQKLLTDAYELSSGRHVVSQRIDGRPQTVQSTGRNLFDTIASGLRQNRSSINQWLVATTLIAFVCGLAHHLHWQLPDPQDIWLVAVTSLACGLIVTSAVYSTLRVSVPSPWSRWSRTILHWSAVMVIAFPFPSLMGFLPHSLLYQIAAATLVFVAIWLSALLTLLRYEGYRLVWVQKVDQGPTFATDVNSRDSIGGHEAAWPSPEETDAGNQMVGSWSHE